MADVLIAPGVLTELLGAQSDPPAVLDVRWTLGGPSGHADWVAGHIPGARNFPVGRTVDAAGRIRPAGALHDELQARGAAEAMPVGAYCGSGVSAAALVLALAHAGVPAALYVGSWSDWITDPDRP